MQVWGSLEKTSARFWENGRSFYLKWALVLFESLNRRDDYGEFFMQWCYCLYINMYNM